MSLLFSYVSKATSTLSPQLNCLQSQAKQIIKIEDAYYDSANQEVLAKIIRDFKEESEINNIEFKITNKDGIVKNYEFGPATSCTSATLPDAGEIKIYYFSNIQAPENLEEIYISIDSCIIDSKRIKIL